MLVNNETTGLSLTIKHKSPQFNNTKVKSELYPTTGNFKAIKKITIRWIALSSFRRTSSCFKNSNIGFTRCCSEHVSSADNSRSKGPAALSKEFFPFQFPEISSCQIFRLNFFPPDGANQFMYYDAIFSSQITQV